MGRSGLTAICCVACAAILFLAACSDGGTAPSLRPDGSYALTSYDSLTLPVVLRVIVENPTTPGAGESVRCEDRLVWMTLTLDASGRFTNTSERRIVCDNGDPDEVTHPAASGSYEQGDGTITLTFDEEDGSTTVATGALSDVAIVITKRVTTREVGGTVTDPTRMEFARVVLN
jgi:hypothetical protein